MLQSTFFKPQDPHGIQGIDKRQTQAKPLVVGLGEGPELIMAPSKVFITLPRMSESFPHCLWPASFWNAKKKDVRSSSRPSLQRDSETSD